MTLVRLVKYEAFLLLFRLYGINCHPQAVRLPWWTEEHRWPDLGTIYVQASSFHRMYEVVDPPFRHYDD